ncbi:MAG TPA: hypothetical protein PKD19_04035 [Candidatus Saccharibacteria bacterium]|nr:hypothetical protein [Candidatus Saccharibacteria bacterium]
MRNVFSNQSTASSLIISKLYDQDSFYAAFERDLGRVRRRAIIESPFLTMRRVNALAPQLHKLSRKGITVIVNTKPLDEHDAILREQAEQAIATLQDMGVRVLMTVGHHRKIAVLDDVLWEGSLNILSQNDSCELMRRMRSPELSDQMLGFTGLNRWEK